MSMISDLTVSRYTMLCAENGDHNIEVVCLDSPEGYLVWRVTTGEVESMFVAADYRRQGIMTRLWSEAQRIQPVMHSEWRTDDGEAFARSTGDYLPERKRA